MPKRIEDEFHCLGYYGFGGGVSLQREQTGKPGTELYCGDGCPLKRPCWDAHRERVRELLPALVAHFDDLVAKRGGDGAKAAQELIKKTGVEPYMSVMMGNIEDGMLVAGGKPPKDRGEYTLKFPFVP